MSQKFNNKVIFGPHNHPQSLDSGNTVEYFLKSAAKDFNRKAIALTDHGSMGAIIESIEISKKMKESEGIDLKVVPGIELYILPDEGDDLGHPYYHLTIHLNDFASYLDACKLSKPSYDRSIYKGGELKPLTTWSELESMSGKITILSGCMISPVMRPILNGRKDISEKYFKKLMQIAGPGKFFVEIFPYEVSKNWNGKTKTFEPIKNECIPDGMLQIACNEWVIYLAEKYKIPVVISEDAHFAKEEEKVIQDLRLSGNGNYNWKMSDANCLHTTEWLYDELKRLHPNYINDSKFIELIDNSEKCLETFKGFDYKFKHALPLIELNGIPTEMSNDESVKYVINKIIKKGRIDLSNPVYAKRLKKEIDELAYNGKINILPYFMILEEIIEWCANNEVLVGPGRGSAAGCLMSYGLGITSVDPIKENLSFERFFDVARVEEGLADIDTDFSKKDLVVDFIKKRWGDRFAFLGTGTTFKTKSSLKDIDRLLYGKVRPETEAICKKIQTSPQGVSEHDFLRGYKDADGIWQDGELEKNKDLADYLRENVESAKMLFKMIGIIRQMGRHAAGVLIADKPIHNFIPLCKVSDEFTTQLLPKWVEKCGGVKYDILGLNTLEDIRLCLKYIKERYNKTIDPWSLPDDKSIWDAAIEDPSAIFQLHTDTVRPGMIGMRPQNVQEAAILTSVYRPGAMDAPSDEDPNITMEKIFIERWNGTREAHAIHPDLEPILGSTKFVIVFQEQIMQIVHDLGGLSMPETQKLRKAISKKASDDLINLLNKVQSNLVKRGWTTEQSKAVCDQMKASGKYCFNKAHAVSYAYVAKACAYLKKYYPAEYWAAVLTNGSKDDIKKYWPKISDIMLPIDINKSTDRFEIVDVEVNGKIVSRLLPPLNMIEGIGIAALNNLINSRPFNSLSDMLQKVDRRIINKKIFIKLIFSECIDQFFSKSSNEFEKISEYFNAKAIIENKKKVEQVPEEYRNLTSLKKELIKKSTYKVYNTDLFKAALPKLSYLKLLDDSGIMYRYRDNNKKYDKVPVVNKQDFQHIMEQESEFMFCIVGFITSAKEKRYKNNTKAYLKVSVELEDALIEAIKWPEFKRIGKDWTQLDSHGINKDIEDSISLLIMKKRKDSQDLSIEKIIVIEEL